MRWSSVTRSSAPSFAFVALSLVSAVVAQGPTDEASEAAIKDPYQECAGYNYDPVSSQSSKFPTNWQVAQIVPGDQEATDKWNSIQSLVPANIQVKGTQPASLMGDFGGFNYDPSDPDCWWTNTKCSTPKHQGIPADIISMPEPDTLGYGFDDGPNCSHNAFYDFLQEKNQKATMYYIGSNVQNQPLQAQRAVTDGHEICVHTWSHHYLTALTSEQVFAEFWYTLKMIKLATGVTPTCFRPPFGDVDDRVRAIANALGLVNIVWKYDSNDWRADYDGYTEAQVDQNYQDFINTANGGAFTTEGAIMLTHELNNFTMSEAMKFYSQLQGAFKHIVPVGVGYNRTQPYLETNYGLPSFEQYIGGQTTVSGSAVQPQSSSSSASLSSSSQSLSTASQTSSATSGSATPSTTGSSLSSDPGSKSNGAASAMSPRFGALLAAGAFVGMLVFSA
ncbi:carbohydrate esterase family 4 protein [Coniophora puteana RWD-64-598 SS2]|uniref:chitin deacetylase n=1 Tax=Coniophora puteana (strain RWD-64-598) TaxID=741705 RepID=A0A5M3MGG4_CONPW|nr:carbohydrate esterase family 4 protein [Coniophora puteana RWD-64-598 SS2]EIW77691.1 carbohydrate esterase family 4 protein [Coniophora puteana RWD-64-598 SS2]